MARVYLETSFVSYLAAWPSRDLILAGHQQITHEWWRKRRAHFEVYVSRLVIEEASAGDEEASQRRLAILKGLPVLPLNPEATELAEALVTGGAFPRSAAEDALHVALAAVYGIDYLLTWNCRHLANAQIASTLFAICDREGYDVPQICTPEQLMGE